MLVRGALVAHSWRKTCAAPRVSLNCRGAVAHHESRHTCDTLAAQRHKMTVPGKQETGQLVA
jgi:hypothetical protein